MRPPAFWGRRGGWARALSPLSAVVAAQTARRVARPGWRAPVPVLCCGNATVGGAGKTTVALDVAARLGRRGVAVHCLSRGYRGRVEGPLRVDPERHDAGLIGDEPLLLAQVAPTWVSVDRAAGARAAIAAGAGAVVMDDGLQNPGLVKTMSLLVVDGGAGFGNGRVLPAGPLRETVAAAASRCRAAVLVGADEAGATAQLGSLPILSARLEPEGHWSGQRLFAFCGIGRPGKFLDTLREAGVDLAGSAAFADHHRFSEREIEAVLGRARSLGAGVVTTAKDIVRVPGRFRADIQVLGIRLAWRDAGEIEGLLDEVMG